MKTRNTKHKLTTFLIYFIFTIVPSLLISFTITIHKMEQYEKDYRSEAHRSASLHANNIDSFIGETAGRLEMLATLIKVQQFDLINIEEILKETHKSDDRFSGFYWANPKGDILISSNSPYTPINISDRTYFKNAIELGKTSISGVHTGRISGNNVITLATPVIENTKPLGMLLASLRIDRLENNINSLLNDEEIVIKDSIGKTIIQTGELPAHGRVVTDHFSLDHVPWTVSASINFNDEQIYQNTFFYYFFTAYIFTNILLLLIYNFRLKWNGRLAKEQYEFQKMELIGNLAASTAHEIRNPLTGISGLVKLLSEEYHEPKAQKYFGVIQNEITRINSIVSELLFLGRPTAHTLKNYNANEILKEIEPILQSEANYTNVQLSISYSANDPFVSCVKDHLKQVILNLSKNSLHAMPNGGELTVSIDSDEKCCIIIVKDTGIGIPKDELDKIFNPFFTKKKDGSGIGLTVCKRIIDSCNGIISIQSTPNIGTQVEIMIPLIRNS
ncbi:ATP-binding protein [Bacillus sp. S/N-304-OC-R1]|uniref:ATP-binding protein n=1 Tax=Bacillus sp. S/N-304-OC-R1 TaxID=2758034 RepID=UPI001C8ED12C|nr:ATP-binding protein [Bacillus sp. S/N-304-OC-R1]MBY0122268.1 histidine kinase [Bacillus sp. S/N-304-OC-R1]